MIILIGSVWLAGCSGQGVDNPIAFANILSPGIGAISGLSGGVAGWGPLQGVVIAGGPSYNPLANALITAYGSPGDSTVTPTVQACASATSNSSGQFILPIGNCPVQGGFVWLSVLTVDATGNFAALASLWTPATNTLIVNLTPLTTLITTGVYGANPVAGMAALEVEFQNQLLLQGAQAVSATAETQIWTNLQALENAVRNDLADVALSDMSYVLWGQVDVFMTPLTLNFEGLDALYSSVVVPSVSPVLNSVVLEGTAQSGGNGSVLLSIEANVSAQGSAGALVSVARGAAVSALQQGQANPQAVLTALLAAHQWELNYQDSAGHQASCAGVSITAAGVISGSNCLVEGVVGQTLTGQVTQGAVNMSVGVLTLNGAMSVAAGAGTGTDTAKNAGTWTLQPMS